MNNILTKNYFQYSFPIKLVANSSVPLPSQHPFFPLYLCFTALCYSKSAFTKPQRCTISPSIVLTESSPHSSDDYTCNSAWRLQHN